MEIRFDRLLDCITALGQATYFDMSTYYRGVMVKKGRFEGNCNSPSCVIGHYEARFLQHRPLTTPLYQAIVDDVLSVNGIRYGIRLIANHFGLTERQSIELFGSRGCGNADSPDKAIAYIKRFIAAHQAKAIVLEPGYLALRDHWSPITDTVT
jgi:hypothetical protein